MGEAVTGASDTRDGAEPDEPITTAHARAIDTAAPSKADRIEHIFKLMTAMEFTRGRTVRHLSELWGLHEDTVSRDAAEAHRMVMCDKDDAARDITITARTMLKAASDALDFRGVKAMGDLLLDVSGARAPAKQELTGKDGERLNGPVIYVPPESDD